VVVKVKGKLRTVNYIARVDVVDNDDFERVSLKKVPGKVDSQETSFIPNSDDEAFFFKEGDHLQTPPAKKFWWICPSILPSCIQL
jgi:hypothetical protein